MMSLFLLAAAAAASNNMPGNASGKYIPSSPSLGVEEGRCRSDERGPSYDITVSGLKDRKGTLRIELYPANEADFLQDDNVLVMAGKPFARVVQPLPAKGAVTACIRAPGPGTYTLSILHDRNANRKFDRMSDGAAFPRIGNLGRDKPKAADVAVAVGNAPQSVSVTMQYFNLLKLGFAKNN